MHMHKHNKYHNIGDHFTIKYHASNQPRRQSNPKTPNADSSSKFPVPLKPAHKPPALKPPPPSHSTTLDPTNNLNTSIRREPILTHADHR